MTLANLLKIGRLKTHVPNGAEIQRLLAAAARNLADARVAAVRPLCCVESWLRKQHPGLLNEN